MVRIIFCLFIAIIHVSAFAQETGSITGKLCDTENTPVEFANVFITSKTDSTAILRGTITDSTGRFALTNLPLSEYIIHFQFIGFVKKNRPFHLVQKIKIRNLGLLCWRLTLQA